MNNDGPPTPGMREILEELNGATEEQTMRDALIDLVDVLEPLHDQARKRVVDAVCAYYAIGKGDDF